MEYGSFLTFDSTCYVRECVDCVQFVTMQEVYPMGSGWGLAVAPYLEGLVRLPRLLALGLHPQRKPGASQTSQGRDLMLEVIVLQDGGCSNARELI